MTPKTTLNPYEVLGLEKSATTDQIKEAYKEKVKLHHPDLGGNEEECKRLNIAYDILSDKDKKAAYDNPMPHGGSGSPFEAFFSQFGRMGGVHFAGGQGGGFTFFQQQTIRCEGAMTLSQMLFGDKEYELASPAGKVKFELPPRTEPGGIFNIRVRKDANGEIILQVRMALKMPEKLTEEQEKMMREL
jgi:DnaJ-class molecular chaperone